MSHRKYAAYGIAALIGATMAVPSAWAEPIEIKFASFVAPQAHINVRVFAPWAERVTRASQGTIKITLVAGGVLGKNGQIVDRIMSGVAGIGFDLQAYYPSKFPKSEVLSLPFEWEKSAVSSLAFWRLYEKGLMKEYDDLVPLSFFAFSNVRLMMRQSFDGGIDGLKGMKLGTGGKLRSLMVQKLGATPISVLSAETYQALSRGVVDGAAFPWTAVQPFRIQEVAKYYIDVPLGGSPGMTFMSKRFFDSLPAPAKKAIMDNSGEAYVRETGKFWDEVETEGREIVRTAPGTKIVPVSAAELEVWRKRVSGLAEEWAAGIENGPALVKAFREEIAKAEKP